MSKTGKIVLIVVVVILVIGGFYIWYSNKKKTVLKTVPAAPHAGSNLANPLTAYDSDFILNFQKWANARYNTQLPENGNRDLETVSAWDTLGIAYQQYILTP
jgi:flagellar basal body-associated protein FliL